MAPHNLTWIAALLALALAAPASAERTYYRFKNADGVVVMKSKLTAQEAKEGYSIVNIHGQVIETVEPEMSAEAWASLSDERKRELEAKEAAEEQRAYDESLLLRYSSVEDLEAEQRRKLAEFDVRISILRGNMASLKDQMDRQQAVAADMERQGRKIPSVIRGNIEDLQEKVRDAEQALASRRHEKDSVDQRYMHDVERFNWLVDRMNRREINGGETAR